MRKFLAVLMAFILCFLTACGASGQSTKSQESFKVGFIYLHDENSTYDANFLNAAKEACAQAGVEYLNKTNIPESSECYDAACELVDQGCRIIFADSFGHEPFMLQAAKEFPNVEFCHATGTLAHTENLPNFHNAFAAIYQGRFLAGVAAGLKLNEMIKEGQFDASEAEVGYIGAHPYAEVISGYTSFYLGIRYVCPSATMKVIYTHSWYDESLEKEAAIALISSGCKLISQHADSMGAPSACEEAGIPNASYNGSTLAACPTTFIVSSRIDWEPYFLYMIECVRNGIPIATDWVGTLKYGSVALTELNPDVAAEGTANALAAVEELLESGALQVFDTSTWTINGEQLSEYYADVDTDSAYTPDTNVIFDGYFHESEYRSAPYFDLIIDGISFLNG